MFVGIERPDWATVQAAVPELHNSVYAATGGTVSVASGRLSFVLGLQGPCVSVDTACSSALVAAHGGGHAVRSAECAIAMASGVGLKLLPYPTLGAHLPGCYPPTVVARRSTPVRMGTLGLRVSVRWSVCAEAEGSSVSESRLAGIAVRQDGRSASLTAPNGSAQRRLLLATLGTASLGAARCGECGGARHRDGAGRPY